MDNASTEWEARRNISSFILPESEILQLLVVLRMLLFHGSQNLTNRLQQLCSLL